MRVHKLWRDSYIRARPSAKFGARCFTPLTVLKLLRLLGQNAVKLNLPRYVRTHPVVQVSLTSPVISNPAKLMDEVSKQTEVLEVDSDEIALSKIREILADFHRGRRYPWITLFEGEANCEGEWQPRREFVDPDEAMTKTFQ